MVKKKNKMKKLAALFSVILLLTAFACLSAFAEGNEAKIGDIEYATLVDALDAVESSTDTVTLLQDVTYDVDVNNHRMGIIDGDNHTLTLNKRIFIGDSGDLTLKNIKVNLSTFSNSNDQKLDAFGVFGGTLTFEKGTEITGANNNIKNVVIVDGDNSVFNMKGGSIENCTVKNAVVRVYNKDGSKAIISGGSIKNNAVRNMSGGVHLEKGTLTITGDPEITGNHANGVTTLFNVNIAGGTFNVEAPFTGKIGVRIYSNGLTGGKAGDEIGSAVGDLTLSEDSIVRDGISTLIGYVSNGKVVLNNIKNAAKIGTTEYATLEAALDAAKATDTVTLLKDVTYDVSGKERKGTIDGAGHKLTLKKRITIGGSGALTLKNITVDLSKFDESTEAFAFWSNTLTFEDGVIITGANNNLKNVVRAAGSASVFNMKGGSIKDCSVNNAVVYVTGGANATISGGSIKNNAVLDMRGGVYLDNGTLTITGNPEILGNYRKDNTYFEFNVNIAGGTFNVQEPFTGKIGVRKYNGATSVAEAGNTIGNAVGNLTLSADSIVRDNAPELFAYVYGTDLILAARPVLTAETDMGKYTVDGDTNEYGVVRVNTIVNKGTDTVEEIGTYFFTTSDKGIGTKNFVKVDATNSKYADGHGYTADVVEIEGDTATIYAVNFYKHKTLGYLYESPVEINFVKTEAKNLGNDPAQLN